MLFGGAYYELRIDSISEHGLYLCNADRERVLLPSKYVSSEMKIGQNINVFLYYDSEDRLVATTQKPFAIAGDIALLRVKDVNPTGAFLDWGLEKDLLLPFKEQRRELQVDDYILVRIKFDKVSGRLLASMRLLKYVQPIPVEWRRGKELNAVILEISTIGYKVLLDDKYEGMLYRSDIHERISIGDRRIVYLFKTRDDGRADVVLQKPGYENAIPDAVQILISVLKEHGGEMNLTAQSPPGEIERLFKMSKKTYKKALGALYKEHKVEILVDKVKLL